MDDLHLTELLYQALGVKIGIRVTTSDPDRLRQKLYALRKQDPDLACLSFTISPIDPAELWIVRKGAKDEARRDSPPDTQDTFS